MEFFLLELDELAPLFEKYSKIDEEYLVEDTPAHYVSAQYAQYGVYDYDSGIPLPKGFQVVCRYVRGKFLIVMKTGPYNRINGTHDGRHGKCTATQFRKNIDQLVELFSKKYHCAKESDGLKGLTDDELEDTILELKEFNNNPFSHGHPESLNDGKIREKHREQQKSKDYIHQEYVNWNFSDMLHDYHEMNTSVVGFAIKFVCPNSSFSLKDQIEETDNYVCIDGQIRKLNAHSADNCYYIYDRDTAIKFVNNLEERITEILKKCNMEKLEEYEHCFFIELIKCGKPTHLFTKQEIEEAMRNADDRFSNQLIIDGNGYARVIQDDRIGHLFPVRHETWDAGNIYVGKYSDLSTLNDDYISSLQGWLVYLETGRTQYMDYVHENINCFLQA